MIKSTDALKKEFDNFFFVFQKSEDPELLGEATEIMNDLANQIMTSLNPSSSSQPQSLTEKFFALFNKRNSSTTISEKDLKMIEDINEKLEKIVVQSSLITSIPQKNPPQSLPPLSILPSANNLTVGFENSGANCWANSFLSMIFSIPTFLEAYEKVAEYYATMQGSIPGSNLEELGSNQSTEILYPNVYAQACREILGENDPLYQDIKSSIERINTGTFFKQLHEKNIQYKANIRGMVNEKYNALLKLDKEHGMALKNAWTAYLQALEKKQPVSKEVTQSVRLAFHHFFGTMDPVTNREIFSSNPSSHEDAHEALTSLIKKCEEIGFEPKFLCPLEIKQQFRPEGKEKEISLENRSKYQKLNQDNCKIENFKDYQIFIEASNQKIIPFDTLLLNFFVDTHVENDDPAQFLVESGKLQTFKRTQRTCQFLEAPKEFLLTCKRFGKNNFGSTFKIKTPVAIHRTIQLPQEATKLNQVLIYELDSFVVHLGEIDLGHYICYKKIENNWIEVNDSITRYVKEEEIDEILEGKKGGTFTSYFHHYTLAKDQKTIKEIQNNSNTQITPSQRQSRFLMHYEGEGKITVRGSFNGWDSQRAPLVENFDPSSLKAGEYEFKFVLNGEKWLNCPNLKFKVSEKGEVHINEPHFGKYQNGSFLLKRTDFDN